MTLFGAPVLMQAPANLDQGVVLVRVDRSDICDEQDVGRFIFWIIPGYRIGVSDLLGH